MTNPRAQRLTLLFTAAAIGLAATFLARVPPLATLCERALRPLLLAVPTCLAALGVGCALRVALERALGQRTHAFGFGTSTADFVVGLPFYGTLCFLVATVSARAEALVPLLGLSAALGAWSLARGVRAPRSLPRWSRGAAVLVALALGCAVVVAQLPPITLDEVAYHLAVPQAWVREGQVVELPLNSHSYFPFGIESAALPLLAWAGHSGATAFHFVMLASFAAALGLVVALAAPLGGELAASLSVVALASTPAAVLTAGTAWIDAPLIALTVGLAGALARAHARDYAPPSLVPVALFVGAGTLSKYTWAFVLVACFGAALLAARGRRAVLARLGLAAFAGLTLGGVFFVRNALWTGNPVAPFLDPASPHVSAFNQGATAGARALNYLYDPTMVDESLGALLVSLALLAPLVRRELVAHPFERALALLAAVALVGIGAVGAAGRLLLPFAALAATLAAAALSRALGHAPRLEATLRWVGQLVAALQLAFVVTVVAEYHPFASLAGGGDEAQLVLQRPLMPAVRFIDAHLPEGSRTLVLGLHESYWFEHRVRAGGNFDGPRVAAYLRAESPSALAARWAGDGFTHVALYAKQLRVGAGADAGRAAETSTTLPPETASLLRATLDRHARVVAQGEGVTLLALP